MSVVPTRPPHEMLQQALPAQVPSMQPLSSPALQMRDEMLSQDLEEQSRGRRRSRDFDDEDGGDNADVTSPDAEPGSGGPSRKRRRSRKGLDKKFECPHEGCGKSYSRAEHLYRHQLNHNPKQIYKCDFPDCRRYFVRQDLCARHKERHTARGSQLQRKDALLQNLNPPPTPHQNGPDVTLDTGHVMGASITPNYVATEPYMNHADSPRPRGTYTSSPDTVGNTMSPVSANTSTTMTSVPSRGAGVGVGPRVSSTPTNAGGPTPHSSLKRQESNKYRHVENALGYDSSPVSTFQDNSPRHSSFGSSDVRHALSPRTNSGTFVRPPLQSSVATTPNLQSLSLTSPYTSTPLAPQAPGSHGPRAPMIPSLPASQGSHHAQQSFTAYSVPPTEFSTTGQTSLGGGAGDVGVPTAMTQVQASDTGGFEPIPGSYAFPVFGDGGFGDESYTRSPFVMADNFAAWLFSEQQQMQNAASSRHTAGVGLNAFADGLGGGAFHGGFLSNDLGLNGFYPHAPMPQQHPMAVTSILDTSPPESLLSNGRRQEIIELIVERFNENDHAPVIKQKEALLDGDRDEDHHVLSLRMMRTYIVSYWHNFHPQLPILHRPTFAADKTPVLLLIAMMSIGGTCLDKRHGNESTQAAANLAQFLAWHLRWAIFSDADFRPPAKLWVFQALLLLETYEKMYATRALHERAHIHHATTITLMRRGSSLIGRSPLGSPPSLKEERAGRGGHGSGASAGSNTPEKWWQRWITSEATRRAAFAAFVIDSIHATMFGHSAVMVAHEMRLPLPCDESLWSAPSSAEVGRIETSLLAQGIKPTTFLDGLKCTLGGQSVRTNSFGQTILMAGLLSVSWHMHQRDLQVHSLGVSQALGGRDKWRVALLKAFDVWQQGFTSPSNKSPRGASSSRGSASASGETAEEASSSRMVLHHLAHMAMHVDIVDCQILAGAGRLLGRSIGPQDYKSAQRRMKDWAPKAQARDAAFYSLRFLCEVLLPAPSVWRTGPAGFISEYSARDDSVLNRPWVVYFAALVVWSYGFALEGPFVPSTPTLHTAAQQHEDMYAFLSRLGRLDSPDDLSKVQSRNACVGTLMVLCDTFRDTRWELLHEAANLLTNCVNKLYGAA